MQHQIPLFMETQSLLPTADEELAGEHGEVFTRRWVVELILDLVGYTPDRDLSRMVAVEPSCGSGAFIVPMIERLLISCQKHGREIEQSAGAIRAVDLLKGNVERSRCAAAELLTASGVGDEAAANLASSWITRDDFLLSPPDDAPVDFVVGNPPYIRLEAVPPARSDAYRRACLTMGGRADVYVGFYERGLLALRPGGKLGFICADRWMRNAYGSGLRAMVADGWSVDAILSMTGVDAFEDEVDAYPAITVLTRTPQDRGPLVVEGSAGFGEPEAREVAELAGRPHVDHLRTRTYRAARLGGWFTGREGWPNGSPDRLALLADLERRLPTLEDPGTGTRVGIGVATGADKIYVVDQTAPVEPERLLPLALPRDIATGVVEWSGKHLVNPWDAQGLVSLSTWPLLSGYLERSRELLSRRHTAKSGRWYKTIDRVIEGLAATPKLYFPDFKDVLFPVLDGGLTYPHHNLYWLTSERWDLRVLGGLLLSDVANLFVEAYSVRMRGGFLRFQAQYLRRIRIPELASIHPKAAEALAAAFVARDRQAATALSLPLYGLSDLPD